ncbi:MAG: NAD(P)H-dependent oxidoreductase [Spirochaetales bacterium]|nr:NAD(P)H-dependent oxidoreductase [Spirochaetales bacterium]
MVDVLLLNGSPRGEKSNTLKLARAFCDGLKEGGEFRINEINLREKRIDPCRGCFACWTISPGCCVIKDDMNPLIGEYGKAEMVIWSFPLYYFSLPSHTKAFMDRLLPLNQPFIVQDGEGQFTPPPRDETRNPRQILISTAGFCSRENNFEGLSKQFEILQRHESDGKEPVQILCPEGELFSQPALQARTGAYLNRVKDAGREVAVQGEISGETAAALEELLYPPNAFMEMANTSWDIRDSSPGIGESPDVTERFIRQMAAVYNPSSWIKDLILEIAFSEPDKTYRLVLGQDKCRLSYDLSSPYTTRIETPFPVWLDISEGRKNGAQAMMDGLYRVKGDFDTMNRMDEYFGTAPEKKGNTPDGAEKRPSSLNYLLFPWIALWVTLPIARLNEWGGLIAIALCAVLSLLGNFVRLTPYDRATGFLVPLLGAAALSGLGSPLLIALSYGLFGGMWLLSGLMNIPLTAWYSSRDYGGETSFENPLFIKTNRILTFCWGILYLAVAPVTLLILKSPLGPYTGLINQAAPLVMGIFTWWFQRWYPAHVASGK